MKELRALACFALVACCKRDVLEKMLDPSAPQPIVIPPPASSCAVTPPPAPTEAPPTYQWPESPMVWDACKFQLTAQPEPQRYEIIGEYDKKNLIQGGERGESLSVPPGGSFPQTTILVCPEPAIGLCYTANLRKVQIKRAKCP